MGRYRIMRSERPLSHDLPAASALLFSTVAMVTIISQSHVDRAARSQVSSPAATIATARVTGHASASPGRRRHGAEVDVATAPAAAPEPAIETEPAGLDAVELATLDARRTALAGAPGVAPGRHAPPADAGFVRLDFDLRDADGANEAARPAANGAVDVRKPLRRGSQNLGEVTVRVDRYSRLFVDAGQLRKVLDRQGDREALLRRLPENGMMGFAELRDRGVDLRYDPIADGLALRPA